MEVKADCTRNNEARWMGGGGGSTDSERRLGDSSERGADAAGMSRMGGWDMECSSAEREVYAGNRIRQER